MIICSRCGFKNHDVAKICNQCNYDLIVNDPNIKEAYVATTLIASFLKFLSRLTLIVGIYVSFTIEKYEIFRSSGIMPMLLLMFLSIVFASILRGLAEVIEQAHQGKLLQDKIYEIMIKEKSDV